jgi:hypothetical protein
MVGPIYDAFVVSRGCEKKMLSCVSAKNAVPTKCGLDALFSSQVDWMQVKWFQVQ